MNSLHQELWYLLCWWPETVKQTVELLVIWDAVPPIWRHCSSLRGIPHNVLNVYILLVAEQFISLETFVTNLCMIVHCIFSFGYKNTLEFKSTINRDLQFHITTVFNPCKYSTHVNWDQHSSILSVYQRCCFEMKARDFTIHYTDVIMSSMASQITRLTIVYWTVYSGTDKKKISKLRVTGLCEENSPVTGEFPPQRTSNAEKVSIWWRHHENALCPQLARDGFTHIDAVEPSKDMLSKLEEKNVYNKVICDIIGTNKLPIEDSEYDYPFRWLHLNVMVSQIPIFQLFYQQLVLVMN